MLAWHGLAVKEGCHRARFLVHYFFVLYVNDLSQAIDQSMMKQYADDTTWSLVSNDLNLLEEGLVNDLENVASWVKVNNPS